MTCLCGFSGSTNAVRYHKLSCSTWRGREDTSRPQKEPDRCPFCAASPSHHKFGCPGRCRGPRFEPPELWYGFLGVLERRYEESGRGLKLMALFD